MLAHLHKTSHSTRYLLGFVIFILPTFLISLLAFLVDILLFIPNLSWGAWIMLAATILIVVCGVLTCAMRRTIVSRKARKARIAENAEMSGESYYANRANQQAAAEAISPPPLPHQAASPTAYGGPSLNTLPSFSTVDQKSPVDQEDRMPLNSQGGTVGHANGVAQPPASESGTDPYGPGWGGGMYAQRGRGGMYNGQRPEYGNGMGQPAAFGRSMSNQDVYGGQYPRRQRSNEGMGGPFGPFRGGRGGYPPRGYGRGGSYRGRGGPMNGGGWGGAPRNALAPAAGMGAGMVAGEMMGRGQRPPPPGSGGSYGSSNGLPPTTI